MAEAKSYTFNHQELAELLVKQQDIHEGFWGIYIEFGFGAANINSDPTGGKVLLPTAFSIVQKIGIQQFPEPSNLTVDAAKVNPRKSSKRPK
jgi:hypothetical protein